MLTMGMFFGRFSRGSVSQGKQVSPQGGKRFNPPCNEVSPSGKGKGKPRQINGYGIAAQSLRPVVGRPLRFATGKGTASAL